MEMPFGYRWIVEEDFNSSDYVQSLFKPFQGGTIVPWDCMVEFGMDHDHDPEECERMIALMDADYYDPDGPPIGAQDDPEYYNYFWGSSRF